MITVSMEMVFRAAIYSLVSGAVFGTLYSFSMQIVRCCSNLFCKCFRMEKKEILRSGFLKNSVDFTVVIFMGISQLISNYVLLDGAFRLYTVILTVLTFFLFKRIFLGGVYPKKR